MKYWIGTANASFVGTEGKWKFTADTETEALDFFRDTAISHIEGYEDPNEYREDTGIDYEYDYSVEEVTEVEYNESDIEVLD